MPEAGTKFKLFDLQEAERMLPLVRTIVKQIVDDFRLHREKSAGLEKFKTSLGPHPSRADLLTVKAREEAIDDLDRSVAQGLRELGELGVEFKDFGIGLIDFPHLRGDEIVYLCWKLDEEKIGYWHPLDTGFTGRQPIER